MHESYFKKCGLLKCTASEVCIVTCLVNYKTENRGNLQNYNKDQNMGQNAARDSKQQPRPDDTF